MTTSDELFDPEFLRKLRTLFFKLRRRRILKQKGVQQTSAIGFTREFKDYRPYTTRDDYRAIDWRLFARIERLFVKLYEEIQEFHVHLLVDRSLSMHDPHPRKRLIALRLAAALAYLGLMNQHRVSVLTFGDHDVRQEVPPVRGQGHIHAILQALSAVSFEGPTNLGTLRQWRPGRDRRGIVFLLSDLLDPQLERIQEALSRTVAWPAETHVVQVLHPFEIAPDVEGEVRLEDVETGEVRQLTLGRRELDRYRTAFADFRDGLRRQCARRQVDFVTWTTDQAFEGMFLQLLTRGSALSHA